MNHYYDVETGAILILKKKSDWWFTKYALKFYPEFCDMWTMWNGVLYYPDKYEVMFNTMEQNDWRLWIKTVMKHETVHYWQQKKYGLLPFIAWYAVLPFPVFLSGRYFIERSAYLVDIRAGLRTVDDVVDLLWEKYAMPWPKPLMRRWFEGNI